MKKELDNDILNNHGNQADNDCKIPVFAKITLTEDSQCKTEFTYGTISVEALGKYIAERLGIDIK